MNAVVLMMKNLMSNAIKFLILFMALLLIEQIITRPFGHRLQTNISFIVFVPGYIYPRVSIVL